MGEVILASQCICKFVTMHEILSSSDCGQNHQSTDGGIVWLIWSKNWLVFFCDLVMTIN